MLLVNAFSLCYSVNFLVFYVYLLKSFNYDYSKLLKICYAGIRHSIALTYLAATSVVTVDHMGGRGKGPHPPISFLPVTFTDIGISSQKFLTLHFNTFALLVQNFTFVPSVSPKLLNLNQDHSSKKTVFLAKFL